MSDSELDQRLRSIEARLRIVEARLGVPMPPRAASVPPAIPSVAPAAPIQPPPITQSASFTSRLVDLKNRAAAIPSAVLEYSPRPPMPAPSKPGALEQTLGLKAAGWIGAIVLVIGAALGVKFAYDQQWFSSIPKWVWLAMIHLAGAVLLATGEIVRRKVHDIPAASLFGAGVATLFLGGYVGYSYYELYDHRVAMILMIVASLIGAAIAMRGQLVSIAVLSLIGGNLAPMLIGDHGAPVIQLLTYLLMLELIALFLSYWGASAKWWTLRGLSLAGTSLWIAMILPGEQGAGLVPITFACVYAALYHTELILSARRGSIVALEVGQVPGVSFTVLVTGALLAALLRHFEFAGGRDPAIAVLVLGAASAALGFSLSQLFGPKLRPLALTHRVLAVALVLAAVPVACSGIAVEMLWASMALVLGVVWLITSSRISRIAGPITWMLCCGHLIGRALEAASTKAALATWLTLLSTPIVEFAVLAWALALAGYVIAWMVLRETDIKPSWKFTGQAISAAATAMALGGAVLYLPPAGATGVMLVVAWLLIGAGRFVPSLRATEQAVAVIILASAKWMIVDTFLTRIAPGWSATATQVILNPTTLNGIALAASVVALWRFSQYLNFSEHSPMRTWGGALLVVLIGWIGSVEIDRAVNQLGVGVFGSTFAIESCLWTCWWTILLTGSMALARKLDPSPGARSVAVLPRWLHVWAIKWLAIDVAIVLLFGGSTTWPAVANPHALAGATVIASLIVQLTLFDLPSGARKRGGALLMVAILWLGAAEVHRIFAGPSMLTLSDPRFAEQVALSIFFALYAIAAIGVGFRIRAAPARYVGLAILALTLLKLVLVDLSHIATGYRILSFIGVGIVMLATSVIYGKVSPRLLGEIREETAA